jgi:hypothetical protein
MSGSAPGLFICRGCRLHFMLRPASLLPVARLSPPGGLLTPRSDAGVSPRRLGPATRRSGAYRDGTCTRWRSAARIRTLASRPTYGFVTAHHGADGTSVRDSGARRPKNEPHGVKVDADASGFTRIDEEPAKNVQGMSAPDAACRAGSVALVLDGNDGARVAVHVHLLDPGPGRSARSRTSRSTGVLRTRTPRSAPFPARAPARSCAQPRGRGAPRGGETERKPRAPTAERPLPRGPRGFECFA